jgi:putative transposase
MKLTFKVKLLADAGQKSALLSTMKAFNHACDHVSQIAFKERMFGQIGLHRVCYRDIRERFNLSAQLAVRAIGKVVESYKADRKRLHRFKEYSAVVYDQRIVSLKELKTVSIVTLEGRCKIPITFGKHAKLEGCRIVGQADLICQRGKFYLCLVVDAPEDPVIEPVGYLGVDMGIVKLATTSDGVSYSGKQVDKVRCRITRFRKALQKCGSKSAKRHLKKLSGKERCFKRNTNHIIAKQLVQTAKGTRRAIAIENLSGFRVTVRKKQREQFGKWSFSELGQFISYKAQKSGIPVIAVDPRNTSRTCSRCGHVARRNRKSQSEFVCQHCGFSLNADLNGAINIAFKASVNTPIAVHTLVAIPQPPGTASLALSVRGS